MGGRKPSLVGVQTMYKLFSSLRMLLSTKRAKLFVFEKVFRQQSPSCFMGLLYRGIGERIDFHALFLRPQKKKKKKKQHVLPPPPPPTPFSLSLSLSLSDLYLHFSEKIGNFTFVKENQTESHSCSSGRQEDPRAKGIFHTYCKSRIYYVPTQFLCVGDLRPFVRVNFPYSC